MGQHSRMDALLHRQSWPPGGEEMLCRNAPAGKTPSVIPCCPLSIGRGIHPSFPSLPLGFQNQHDQSQGKHLTAPLQAAAQALRHRLPPPKLSLLLQCLFMLPHLVCYSVKISSFPSFPFVTTEELAHVKRSTDQAL